MTTTSNTTTRKKTTVKKTTAKSAPAKKAEAPKPVVEKKSYEKDELIPCSSVFPGSAVLVGRKTGNIYNWDEIGDVTEVEYQDLMSEIVNKRSSFIYDPLILIQDEDIVNSRPAIKELYSRLVSTEDIKYTLMGGDVAEIRKILKKIPTGMIESVKCMIFTMIENHELRDIGTMKIVDAILKTELAKQVEIYS